MKLGRVAGINISIKYINFIILQYRQIYLYVGLADGLYYNILDHNRHMIGVCIL